MRDRDSQDLRRYIGTGLLIGFLSGIVEAAIVNRTGPVFIPYAALAYGILFSLGFLLLGLAGRALRRDLLPTGIAGAIALSIILEAAFWLNKKSPLPAGSTHGKVLNLIVLLAGIALGILAARLFRRRLAAAASLRRMLWVLAGLIILLGVYFTFIHFQSSRGTNCILISIDALRPDHLGCYGYHRDTSPNIDRLAAGGTMWQRAFSTCPGSTAGHASMLTGLFALSHGAYSNGVRLPDEVLTAAEVFKQNGYATAAFTRNWFISPDIGFGQGFDCFVDNGYGLILKTATPRTLMLGLVLSQTLIRIIRWPGRPSTLEIETALDWMRSRRRHRFFMFLHIMDAHSPYIPPDWAAGRFGEGDLSRGHIQHLHDESLSRKLTAEESSFLIDRYDEEILAADLKIGMVTDELERLGILDNTMIILLADHGEVMDEAEGKQFGHGTLDYGGLRIPMIMHFPGVIPVCNDAREAVQCIDILSTVTGLLDLDDPAHRQGIFLFTDGGNSLGADPLNADSLIAERSAFASADILERDEYTIITPRWQYKIIGDSASLHHLEDSPYDAPDVMGSHPAVAESLNLLLSGWMEKCLAEAVVPFSAEGRSVKPGQEVHKKLRPWAISSSERTPGMVGGMTLTPFDSLIESTGLGVQRYDLYPRGRKGVSMHRKVVVLTLMGAMILTIATGVQALDRNRKGFIIGLGGGLGFTSYQHEEDWGFETSLDTGDRETAVAFATDFRIGGGFNEHFMLYYENRVAWLSAEDFNGKSAAAIHGVGLIGFSYYLKPTTPTWYLVGSVGTSDWMEPFEENRDIKSGFGLSGGAGYEFARRVSVEGTVNWGTAKATDGHEDTTKAMSVLFTICYIWY